MKIRFLWMFHGVMAALEFLVLSVPVRIGVEQLPLPHEPCSSFLYARLIIFCSVYMTLLFLYPHFYCHFLPFCAQNVAFCVF